VEEQRGEVDKLGQVKYLNETQPYNSPPISYFQITVDEQNEWDSEKGSEENLYILDALNLIPAERKMYEIVVNLMHKITWEKFLELKFQVFKTKKPKPLLSLRSSQTATTTDSPTTETEPTKLSTPEPNTTEAIQNKTTESKEESTQSDEQRIDIQVSSSNPAEPIAVAVRRLEINTTGVEMSIHFEHVFTALLHDMKAYLLLQEVKEVNEITKYYKPIDFVRLGLLCLRLGHKNTAELIFEKCSGSNWHLKGKYCNVDTSILMFYCLSIPFSSLERIASLIPTTKSLQRNLVGH
jgi:hypothetical protein